MHREHHIAPKLAAVFMSGLLVMLASSGAVAACATNSATASLSNTNATKNNPTTSAPGQSVATNTLTAAPSSQNQVNTDVAYYILDTQLHEHAALATPTLKAQLLDQPDASALMNAMDTNSQMIANTIDQLYPGTRDRFLQLWRDHITYYQQYLTAAQQNDQTGKQQAKQNLERFVTDATTLLTNTNQQVNADALARHLAIHGNQTLAIIDALVASDYPTVYQLSHQAYEHMTLITAALYGVGMPDNT